MIPAPIGKNDRIDQLPATGAFPRIKRAHKVVILFCKHSSSALWTLHDNPSCHCYMNQSVSIIVITPIVPISAYPQDSASATGTPFTQYCFYYLFLSAKEGNPILRPAFCCSSSISFVPSANLVSFFWRIQLFLPAAGGRKARQTHLRNGRQCICPQ